MAKKPDDLKVCLEHLTISHIKNELSTPPEVLQKHLTTSHLRQALQPQQQPSQDQPTSGDKGSSSGK